MREERQKKERERERVAGIDYHQNPCTFRVPLTTSLLTSAVLPLLYDTCERAYASVCVCVSMSVACV